MKRVASLYLPDWPIERIVQAERAGRTAAPPDAVAADPRAPAGSAVAQAAAGAVARGGGWRPGARWAQSAEPPRDDAGRTGAPPAGDAQVTGLHRHAGPPASTQHDTRQNEVRHGPRNTAGVTDRWDIGTSRLLVTSTQRGNALVIAAASPAARACGIVPGMAVTQARAQAPGLDIRPAGPDADRAALLRLAMRVARRWCPVVMLSGEDGLLLDITGTAHLFGGEARMARRIVRLLARAGFTARVAVADTPAAAWALARFATLRSLSDSRHPFASASAARGDAGTLLCPAAAHVDLLAPLPIAALRLEPRAIDLLKRFGVDTVGQLAALPRAPLARRFGGSLLARLDQATGRLPEPLEPIVPPEHVAVVQRFAEPIATAEAIAHWLGQLMPRLVAALAQAGLGARMVDLVADRIDGVPQCLRIGLARPTRDAAHLLRLAVRRIEEIAPGYGIDALALHVRRADPLGAQNFTETLEDRAPDLAPLIDTLSNRVGPERLWRMAPFESDVPERSLHAVAPLDPPESTARQLRQDDVRRLDLRAPDHPWHPRWPRPARLLRRPEPIDHVMAELPDHAPRRFTWRGEIHRVVRADGPERIGGEWWRRPSERDAIRDYYQVEDEAGQRFWLFRRGDGERAATGDLSWFMHGSFG